MHKRIEDHVDERLTGNAHQNAARFVAHLRANEMLFERGKGYWEDKIYWMIKYKNEYVCFILINGSSARDDPWIIWSDDSDSHGFEDALLDEQTKEMAWAHVDFCGNCGGDCRPGSRKIIFGKTFEHVCRTTMKFINPDAVTLACAEKMVDIRKQNILRNA